MITATFAIARGRDGLIVRRKYPSRRGALAIVRIVAANARRRGERLAGVVLSSEPADGDFYLRATLDVDGVKVIDFAPFNFDPEAAKQRLRGEYNSAAAIVGVRSIYVRRVMAPKSRLVACIRRKVRKWNR